MTMETSAAKEKAASLMPALIDDLKRLVAIPSCAFEGFPAEPVERMAQETVNLFREAGVPVELLDIPNGYPAIWADMKCDDPNAPTVLLYAHYDVQPTPADQKWNTDPWVATEKDGRIYGRGAADDKAGIVAHLGAMRLYNGKPPCNIKILIEGEEETGRDNLAEFIKANPSYADCDAFIIADGGNLKVGEPALTTGLRGAVSAKVTVKTFDSPLHSGLFGGAVPDALVTLIQLLSTLHDDKGNTVIDGLTKFDWQGVDVEENQLRADAGLIESATLVGEGTIGSRLWSRPSATVIGMDVPPIAGTPNALIPEASAKVSLRIAPGSDPAVEFAALQKHLEDNVKWGAQLTIEQLEAGDPFLLAGDDPVAQTALDALSDAWSTPAVRVGVGGSIPLVAVLQEACPRAGVLILGAEDMEKARIHSANESVDPSEIEKVMIAEALFMDRLTSDK